MLLRGRVVMAFLPGHLDPCEGRIIARKYNIQVVLWFMTQSAERPLRVFN